MKRNIDKRFIRNIVLKEVKKNKIKNIDLNDLCLTFEKKFSNSLNSYFIKLQKMQNEKQKIKTYIVKNLKKH